MERDASSPEQRCPVRADAAALGKLPGWPDCRLAVAGQGQRRRSQSLSFPEVAQRMDRSVRSIKKLRTSALHRRRFTLEDAP